MNIDVHSCLPDIAFVPFSRSENQVRSIDIGMPASKNRMRSFRARRALAESAEQKESRLAVDRKYRKQRLADFRVQKPSEEWQTYLASRSQYEVKRLADKRAKENGKDRNVHLTAKCAKEASRRQNLRACETDEQRKTRLERDRDQHR